MGWDRKVAELFVYFQLWVANQNNPILAFLICHIHHVTSCVWLYFIHSFRFVHLIPLPAMRFRTPSHLIHTDTMATPMPMRPPQGMPIPPGAVPQGAIPPGIGPPPMQISANPALQSLLDSLPHNPVPFTFISTPVPGSNPPGVNLVAVCPAHKQSLCEICGADFNGLNYMHQFLRTAPPEAIPPPPNVQPPPQRAEMIKNAKEQGNVRTPYTPNLLSHSRALIILILNL